MEKKELKEFVKKEIDAGNSRQEILEELIASDSSKEKEFAEIIKNIPTHNDKKKNKRLNSFLGIYLILTSLLKLSGIEMFSSQDGIFIMIFPVINIVLAIALFRFVGKIYSGLIGVNFIYLINVFQDLKGEINNRDLLIQALSVLIIIVISLILKSKLTAKYEVRKAWSSDESNKRKMVDKIYFIEN